MTTEGPVREMLKAYFFFQQNPKADVKITADGTMAFMRNRQSSDAVVLITGYEFNKMDEYDLQALFEKLYEQNSGTLLKASKKKTLSIWKPATSEGAA